MFNAARSLANRRARSHSGLSHGYIVGGLGFTLENQRVGFAPRMDVPDVEADAPNSSPATKRTPALARIAHSELIPSSLHGIVVRRDLQRTACSAAAAADLGSAAGFNVPKVKRGAAIIGISSRVEELHQRAEP